MRARDWPRGRSDTETCELLFPPDGPETAGTCGGSVLVIGGFDGMVPRRDLPRGTNGVGSNRGALGRFASWRS